MRKLSVSLLTLCLLVMLSMVASAEKTDWSDKNYDFSKIKTARIENIVLTDTEEFSSDLLSRVLEDDYMKNAARPKYEMVSGDTADIYVKAELLKWHDDFYIVPEHTTWERQTMKKTIKHSDGRREEKSYYVTVPVVHPPRRVNTSTVRLKFDVYDAKTNKLIMSRDELRLRDESTHGQKGIFGRICKSFFDDLGKKIRNGH